MDQKHIFDIDAIEPPKRDAWKRMLPLSLLLVAVICVAWYFGWDAKAVGAGVLLFGVVSNVSVWILGSMGLVPVVGPVIV